MKDKKDLKSMRHSAEHVLMHAMKNLGYKLHMAMGPAIDDGYYFDFDLIEGEIKEEDFKKIEKEMYKIINKNLPITYEELSVKKAKEMFKDNPYKQEWIDEANQRGEKISIYRTGDSKDENSFVDICKGPHVKSTGEVGAVKLLSIAGAYWRGDEKNKMLTRIYGTAFPTKEELKDYLWKLEEAKKRNHRKIGKELELFAIFDEVGQGLPVWLPNGYAVRRALEDYFIQFERDYGYSHILTPHINKEQLFETSGHLGFYNESMYPAIEFDDEKYYLKPMNCPAGMMVYKMKSRSYNDLPLKIGELGTVYRYEKSGELHGLQRVRGFTQNDAHIYCTGDQLEESFMEVIKMLQLFFKDLGFDNYWYRLSVSDPEKDKYKICGTRKDWEFAEETMRTMLKRNKIDFVEVKGEAAFYGPKVDVQAVNVFGKEDSISTIQVDFNLPERFDLEYIDADGTKKRPYVIHRAIIGSFERFFAFLIEHYGGAFPLWLHFTQAVIIPISKKQNEYADKVFKEIKKSIPNLRLEMDQSDETLQKKVRNAQMQKIPYMIILGAKEEKNKTVNVRLRNGEKPGELKVKDLVKDMEKKIQEKTIE